MVRPTRRGVSALAAAVALAFSSALFRDFLVEAALLVALVVVVAEGGWTFFAARDPRAKFVLAREGEAQGARVVLRPGQESVQRVKLTKKIGGTVELRGRVNFLRVEPGSVRGTGASALELVFATEYAGVYSGSEIGATVTGPLGLFSSTASIPFDIEYLVYPRLLRVAARTVRLLALAEIGETPVDMPGAGSEYYEMRGYLAGDDVRDVNWKASAREGGLVVVEHMREVGSHILLVLDARAEGFDGADRLATTFLTLANSLWATGVAFGVLVHDGFRVVEFSPEDDQRRSLRTALRAAISFARLGAAPELLELVPSKNRREARDGPDAGSLLSELEEVRSAGSRLALEKNDPWGWMAELVRGSQTRRVVYVSALAGDVRPLVELAWESRHYRSVEFAVANPCETESNATLHRKLARAISAAGATYLREEPVELARLVLSA